jgi:hypothetical protein
MPQITKILPVPKVCYAPHSMWVTETVTHIECVFSFFVTFFLFKMMCISFKLPRPFQIDWVKFFQLTYEGVHSCISVWPYGSW